MTTPENIIVLKSNEIFVFGSNLAGHHLGGAARWAFDNFGAEWCVGEGMTGKCYAFPTLDVAFRKLSQKRLVKARDNLFVAATANPHLTFLLTKVGCGIAGHPEYGMRVLFVDAPDNVIKPKGW